MTYPLLADPLERGWTALQSWNPERGVGALLAFRQQDERSVRLRSRCATCPPGSEFELLRGPERGAGRARSTSQQLREGLDGRAAEKDTAEVLLIRRVRG